MTASDSTVPVAPGDRVSDVIARDEALVDVFVRAAPHFSKLRNRAMRRVMARLITVEQAARTAGIAPEKLVRDLNSALGFTGNADDAVPRAAANEMATGDAEPGPGGRGQPGDGGREEAGAVPPRRPADAPVREVDVREDLRAGNEPFSKIMAAVAELGDREILRLRTTFEPVPLFTVLGKRGFVHESEEHGADDWSVWFWRPAGGTGGRGGHGAHAEARDTRPVGSLASASDGSTSTHDASADASADGSAIDSSAARVTSIAGVTDDEKTLVLDVRGLNPPEPLMRTLTALETLPEGHQLLQINARVPQFLFPMLVERGFACEVDESHADRVLVRIWRPA